MRRAGLSASAELLVLTTLNLANQCRTNRKQTANRPGLETHYTDERYMPRQQ